MSEPLVSVRDVFCVHRTPQGDVAALQGATLDVASGQLTCVLGPSGAGKSTLLRVIAGLQRPAAGEVLLAGSDIGRLGDRERSALRRARIGFVAQDSAAVLMPELTAREAVALPLALRGNSRRQQLARADQLLEATRLSGRRDALPHELSGGERQRVALCAALAHRPGLLLADEPTAELDADAARDVRRAIASVVGEAGMAAVIVSHDPATSEIASRTVLISDGRIAGERRDGATGLVVGRGGWVQLPEALIDQAGIGSRVRARAREGELILSAVDPPASPTVSEPAAGSAQPKHRDRPAAVAAELRVEGVSVSFGRTPVLQELSFSFPAGRMTAVTGPSGSGKTTLLELLAGLTTAPAGDVTVDSHRLGAMEEEQRAALRRGRIGYLSQDPAPLEFLSAAENIELGLSLRGWDRSRAAARAGAVLADVGLAERSRQRVAGMSAGEAQRVALARALAGADGLLIVDEPTSRVDRATAGLLAELLDGAAAGGQTVVCATHDPDLIARAATVLEL